MKAIPSNPPKTLLTIAIGFFILALIALSKSNPIHVYLNTVVILVSLIGLTSRKASLVIEKYWHALARILSKIFPPIILGIIYYIALVPLALASRLFRKKDPLLMQKGYPSTFKVVDKQFDAKSMANPW